jgi:hypothetical protein
MTGYPTCSSLDHEDDHEAMECAAGTARYLCSRQARRNGWQALGLVVGVWLAVVVLGVAAIGGLVLW